MRVKAQEEFQSFESILLWDLLAIKAQDPPKKVEKSTSLIINRSKIKNVSRLERDRV